MATNRYRFSLSFDVPIAFTTGAFDPSNPTLVQCVTRLEPQRCHRLLVAIDAAVAAAWPNLVDDIRRYVGAHSTELALVAEPLIIDGGEASKQGLDAAFEVVAAVNAAGIDRQSFVVAIGGGAVLDTVSFAAAIAHRGVRVIRFPTTTLSQGDSGVAVKNGVNYFGKKNFVGTFVPPFAVINDVNFLSTLDPRDRRSGLSEAVKVALLRDPAFFDWIERHAAALDAGDASLLAQVVERSAELHANHIFGNGDPFELGSARPMDFGHWAAHKLEALTQHVVRHGEAVAIGMALDLCYAVRVGMLEATDAERILTVLEHLGFRLFDPALQLKTDGGTPAVLAGLEEFREHLGGEMHITHLQAIGRGVEVHAMRGDVVMAAIGDLAARLGRQATSQA